MTDAVDSLGKSIEESIELLCETENGSMVGSSGAGVKDVFRKWKPFGKAGNLLRSLKRAGNVLSKWALHIF